jgi:SAM-dependent methyltransferase
VRSNISSRVRDAFQDETQQWRKREELPRLFWRDDDLAKWSPALDSCLRLANERHIHVAFAAIPTRLTQRASEAVRSAECGRLALHGYAHVNHAAPGADACEYPAERSPSAVLTELQNGLTLLRAKAGERFLNMFVPPWGRFDRSFGFLLKRAGLACFSGNAKSAPYAVPLQLDCQVLAEHGRSPLELDFVIGNITRLLRLRRTGKAEGRRPIGLMTHHGTFGPHIVDTLRELLDFLIDAGFSFSDFSDVDAAAAQQESELVAPPRTPRRAFSSAEDASAALKVLGTRTLPRAGEGYPGLDKVLSLLAGMSPVALLRFTHMHELARRLPDSATLMSAGCGTAVAEVALAMMHPGQRWVAVDADAERFQKMRAFAEEADVSNITFEVLDLERIEAPETGSDALRRFDAIVMVEVMVYLTSPDQTMRSLARLLKVGGELCCIEPFAPDDQDEATLNNLRKHTRSRHGGFSHGKVRTFVQSARNLELVQLYNCYRSQVYAVVDPIWRQIGVRPEPALVDLAFAAARLDIGGGITNSRRDATAVAFLARAI